MSKFNKNNSYLLFWKIKTRNEIDKDLPELHPELPAGKAVDDEVDEAVEYGAESDDMIEHKSVVTGQILIAIYLKKNLIKSLSKSSISISPPTRHSAKVAILKTSSKQRTILGMFRIRKTTTMRTEMRA